MITTLEGTPGSVGDYFVEDGPRATILMYRRVADLAFDPLRLSVSVERFNGHLAFLARHMSPLSLGEMIDRLHAGTLPPRAVAVAFEDGYADALAHGLPLLRRWCIPVTMFAATGYAGCAREFWWDEVQRLIFTPEKLPSMLTIGSHDQRIVIDLGAQVAPPAGDRMLAWHLGDTDDPTPRHAAFRRLLDEIRTLPVSARRHVLDGLDAQCRGAHPVSAADLALSREQLREFAQCELVEMAGHSVSHVPLEALTHDRLDWEIAESQRFLEHFAGCRIEGFAYPDGEPGGARIAAEAQLRRCGFGYAVTGRHGVVTCADHVYRLPRIEPGNVEVRDLERMLIDAGALTQDVRSC